MFMCFLKRSSVINLIYFGQLFSCKSHLAKLHPMTGMLCLVSRPNPRLSWDRIGPPKSLSSLYVEELPYVALSFGAIPKVTAFMSKMKRY